MKIQKSELAGKINKVRGIVPKKTTIEALQGVLVADGYLMANNMETAAKVKVEAATGEAFIIPAKAFDLINSLPDGEVEIKPGKDSITIKVGSIKNKFATLGEDQFIRPNIEKTGGSKSFVLPSEEFLKSIKRVAFAVGDNAANAIMNTLCLRAKDGVLNYIGLDGHMIAWDKADYEGDFELLIPKKTIEKLLSIGLTGDLTIEHNGNGALFITEECEVSTRLVEGNFFDTNKMMLRGDLKTTIERRPFMEALNRARMCCMGENAPVKMDFEGDNVGISTAVATADYSENLLLAEKIQDPLKIAFDSRLLMECLKAFDNDEVKLTLSGPKAPVLIEAEKAQFLTLILPVNLGGAA